MSFHAKTNSQRLKHESRRGAVLVLMVFLLPVVLLLCAFAINMAYMELNRTQMYAAADAAARAGGREYLTTRDQVAATAKAKQFALLNDIANKPLTLQDSDVVFGRSTRIAAGRYSFAQGGSNPNAVEITARRVAGSADGPIPLLMPNVFGVSSFQTQISSVSSQVEVDIALVIDRSGSMAYAANEVAAYPPVPASAPPGWDFCHPVPPNSRWLDMVAAVQVFLNEVSNSPADELVSISTYNNIAVTEQDLTSNYSLITAALSPYSYSFCAGGTNIGGGINKGISSLTSSPNARPGAWKVVIVLTDGIHNTGSDPVSAAQSAANAGAQIFTITFSNEADQNKMKSVATKGGGVHFHASNASDLVNVFQDIAKRLPTLLTH